MDLNQYIVICFVVHVRRQRNALILPLRILHILQSVWNNIGMDRTVQVRLLPTDEQASTLKETIQQFTESFNTVCRAGWEKSETNSYNLHHFTYRACKTALPQLVSDLHIQAIRKASESLKSANALIRKGRKVSCPQSNSCSPRYNLHTFKVYWDKVIISMSTTVAE